MSVPVPDPELPAYPLEVVTTSAHLEFCEGAVGAAVSVLWHIPTIVRSPLVLVTANEGDAVAALNLVPLFAGVAWSTPLAVTTPSSAFVCEVVHEDVAVCEPLAGAIT